MAILQFFEVIASFTALSFCSLTLTEWVAQNQGHLRESLFQGPHLSDQADLNNGSIGYGGSAPLWDKKLSRAPWLEASGLSQCAVDSTCMNMATVFMDQTRIQVRI
jgi:hypothetical protein